VWSDASTLNAGKKKEMFMGLSTTVEHFIISIIMRPLLIFLFDLVMNSALLFGAKQLNLVMKAGQLRYVIKDHFNRVSDFLTAR